MDTLRCRHNVLAVAACCLEKGYQVEIVIFPTSAVTLHAQARVWSPDDKGWKWASTFLNWIRYSSMPEYAAITREDDHDGGWRRFTFTQYVQSGEWSRHEH